MGWRRNSTGHSLHHDYGLGAEEITRLKCSKQMKDMGSQMPSDDSQPSEWNNKLFKKLLLPAGFLMVQEEAF